MKTGCAIKNRNFSRVTKSFSKELFVASKIISKFRQEVSDSLLENSRHKSGLCYYRVRECFNVWKPAALKGFQRLIRFLSADDNCLANHRKPRQLVN